MRAEEARRLTEESKLSTSSVAKNRHLNLTFEEILGVIEYSSRLGHLEYLYWGRLSEEAVAKLEKLGYRVSSYNSLGGPTRIDWAPPKRLKEILKL